MDTIIKLENVSKVFKNKELYRNVNLEIKKGECIGIVGGNGSGKSVLFQLISGLLPTDSGKVIVNNKTLGKNGNDFPSNMGILINEPGYIEHYSGLKNLELLAAIKDIVSTSEIKKIMELVGLNPEDKTPVKKYSMGMKQKLGIAQAIMENQEIIILDEPYNALDFQTNKDITELLMKLKKIGKTILLTSHQHNYLDKLCDKMYCIDNKQVVDFNDELRKKYFDYQ